MSKAKTTAPVQTGNLPTEPEFVRVQDLKILAGIRRGLAYRKITDGTFKSVLLREPGNKQGCRLVFWPSVKTHLHKLMAETPAIDAKERAERIRRAENIRQKAQANKLAANA